MGRCFDVQVHNSFYSWVRPTPTGTDPYLICHSPEMASTLGLDRAEIERPEFALLFSGNATTPSIGRYVHSEITKSFLLADNAFDILIVHSPAYVTASIMLLQLINASSVCSGMASTSRLQHHAPLPTASRYMLAQTMPVHVKLCCAT